MDDLVPTTPQFKLRSQSKHCQLLPQLQLWTNIYLFLKFIPTSTHLPVILHSSLFAASIFSIDRHKFTLKRPLSFSLFPFVVPLFGSIFLAACHSFHSCCEGMLSCIPHVRLLALDCSEHHHRRTHKSAKCRSRTPLQFIHRVLLHSSISRLDSIISTALSFHLISVIGHTHACFHPDLMCFCPIALNLTPLFPSRGKLNAAYLVLAFPMRINKVHFFTCFPPATKLITPICDTGT